MVVMAVPTKRVKQDVEADLDHYASQRWPDLEEVTLTWRGSYAYVRVWTTMTESVPVARIRYLGHPQLWEFAIYRASHEDYEPSRLPNGDLIGTPQDALDCALGLYLADPTAWQINPPKE
jgi:hypothetical protein